jgi:hypothetical protein
MLTRILEHPSLRSEILSYLFFALLIAATFLV